MNKGDILKKYSINPKTLDEYVQAYKEKNLAAVMHYSAMICFQAGGDGDTAELAEDLEKLLSHTLGEDSYIYDETWGNTDEIQGR